MAWSIEAAFSYIHIGRWQPSKFFIFELLTLYDICIWYNQLSFIFIWIHFVMLKKLQPSSILYIVTLFEEINDIMNWVSVPVENLNNAEDLVALTLPKFPIPDIDFEEELDIVDKINQVKWIFIIMSDMNAYYKSIYEPTDNTTLPPDLDTEINSFICPLPNDFAFYFPNDKGHNYWIYLPTLQNLDWLLYISRFEKLFWKLFKFDTSARLNAIHVVRSYINRFIWRGVRDVLFYYIYFCFPEFEYFPHHFTENIIKWYMVAKNSIRIERLCYNNLTEEGVENDSKPQVKLRFDLPHIWELGFSEGFLNPLHKDKWLPWFEFKCDIIYKIKPFNYKISLGKNIKPYFFTFISKNSFYINFLSDFIIDSDTIVDFLSKLEILPIKIEFYKTANQLENLNFYSFFIGKSLNFIARVLYKKIFSNFFYLKYLWSFKLLIRHKISNDNFYFTLNYLEFKVKEALLIAGRWRGRKWKKELYYFESEADIFENKKFFSDLNNINSRLKFRKFFFSRFWRNNYFYFMRNRIYVGYLKPF